MFLLAQNYNQISYERLSTLPKKKLEIFGVRASFNIHLNWLSLLNSVSYDGVNECPKTRGGV
jgi:hypothetical protein